MAAKCKSRTNKSRGSSSLTKAEVERCKTLTEGKIAEATLEARES